MINAYWLIPALRNVFTDVLKYEGEAIEAAMRIQDGLVR